MTNQMNSEIQLIFPTPIMIGKLDRNFYPKEIDAILNQTNNLVINDGNKYSKNTYILNEPDLKNLKEFVTQFINHYLKTVYKPKHKLEAYVTQSWLNFSDFGDFHHIHSHDNSFISGVLYIQANDGANDILFHKPQISPLKIIADDYDIMNSDSCLQAVQSKNIIAFPSNLVHSVRKSESKETRISLAFNSFLRGTLGENMLLTELKL